MQDKKIRVSLRTDIIDKANEQEQKLLGKGWFNHEITVRDLMGHVANGHPFGPQWSAGKRDKNHFIGTDLLVADMDKGVMTIDEAMASPFVRDNATVIYTTPRHTPEEHRFRIVFVLDRRICDADSYSALYSSLKREIPTDPQTGTGATFFYGCRDTEMIWIGKSLPVRLINEMITLGMRQSPLIKNTAHSGTITPNMLVKVKNLGLRELGSLTSGTSIHCPFGTHADHSPSAFVKVNHHGTRGVECRSCGQSSWTESTPRMADTFDTFDRAVRENAGQANSHFQYVGLTQFEHELETSIATHNFHLIEQEKITAVPTMPGIHLIKSPKGSGKTHALVDLLSRLKDPATRKTHGLTSTHRTILIGHRQSLIRESAQKLGLECYLDTKTYDREWVSSGGSYDTLKPRNYAICLDSLHTRIVQIERYGVVVIDESEQVFAHFLSEQMKHPTQNFTVISRLIQEAKFVYCLDADLDRITLTGIFSCLAHNNFHRTHERLIQNIYCYLNEFKGPKRSIKIYDDKTHLEDEVRKSLRSGKRCYITSNSKKFVTELYMALNKGLPEKRFLLVTTDTGQEEDIRFFLDNVRDEILNYDAIFSSPSIGTGIDITFPNNDEKIDVVYGFFETNINTHFDIDQQLGRVRHPKEIRVWITKRRHRKLTDIDTIRTEILNGKDNKAIQFYLDQEGAYVNGGRHAFIDLIAEVHSTRRRSINNLRQNFINLKKANGWEVCEIERDQPQSEKGKIIDAAGKKTRKKQRIQDLLTAKTLSFKEIQALEKRKKSGEPITRLQNIDRERYFLENFYRTEITESLIIFDDEGRNREAIRLFEIVNDPDLRITDYDEIEDSKLHLSQYKKTDKEVIIQRAVFIRQLLECAGLFDRRNLRVIQEKVYTKDSLDGFVEFIKRHQDRFIRLFNKEINQHIHERPPSQLGTVLGFIGLKNKEVKRNRGKNSGPAQYQIDPVSYFEIMKIVDRRRKVKDMETKVDSGK